MGKKYLIVNGNVLNEALNKIKKIIDFEKFDNTKKLIDTYDKLPNDERCSHINYMCYKR